MRRNNHFIFFILALPTIVGCLVSPPPANSLPTLPETQTPVPNTFTPTAIPSLTSTPEPTGCQKPIDDYSRVMINGWTINERTLSMLAHAQELYGGEIDLTGYSITQGSYHDNGSASFGTHLGGGAVDLSVMRRGTWTVLWDDIPILIPALRAAGFAAWFRDYGELYQDSGYHIHAIAIGDQELSPAAIDQLTGPAGYFRGYIGLPIEMYGEPKQDQFGGPVVCQWMIDLGYSEMH